MKATVQPPPARPAPLVVTRPRSPVSFFHLGTQGHSGAPSGIKSVVEWSKTSRGGKQYDLLHATEETKACASAYGLCE